ncbi:enoyl-CoA-hydratase DpgB [Streptomyces sp. 150FB]|uniref:enoyl-CoA-hydratase DpgB n=1 Tax=Streptomyces sp. 150FB TaxID=1576605 RepID=UPI000A6AE4CF
MKDIPGAIATAAAQFGTEAPVLRIDGRHPLSVSSIDRVNAVCDSVEDGTRARVIVQVSGFPEGALAKDLTVSTVSKWERALRRLERLPVPTIAVAEGACGGLALDALLSTDYRIATGSTSLVVTVDNGVAWPGMALYRLARSHAGAAAVRRAVLFGVPVSAPDALALQLVDALTDDLPGALATAVERTGSVRGSELAIRRQLLFDAPTTSFEEAVGAHLAACDRALRQAASPEAAA